MSREPIHMHRSRHREWTPKERLAKAQKASERHRADVKITLPRAPWIKDDKKATA